jgi:hypothetical protein
MHQSVVRGRPFPTGGSITASFHNVLFRVLRADSLICECLNFLILPVTAAVKINIHTMSSPTRFYLVSREEYTPDLAGVSIFAALRQGKPVAAAAP